MPDPRILAHFVDTKVSIHSQLHKKSEYLERASYTEDFKDTGYGCLNHQDKIRDLPALAKGHVGPVTHVHIEQLKHKHRKLQVVKE